MSAIIAELDTLFLGGFALSSEVLASRLEKYGIPDNAPNRFLRYFYGKPTTTALTDVLPAEVDVAHVERRLAATYAALLQQNALAALPAIKQLFRPLVKSGIQIAVITHLRPATIQELFDGICDEVHTILDSAPLSIGIQPVAWQQALNQLNAPVRHTLALVSCGASVRSAIRIGLKAAVILDPITAFDSLTGADLVTESITKTFLTKLKTRLLP